MQIKNNTSKIKKVNFILSEVKSLIPGRKSEMSRVIFIAFLIPIVILGVLYAINIAMGFVELHFYSINPVTKASVIILRLCACFFIITPLVSEIFVLCYRISKKESAVSAPGYYKILYFFFGLSIRVLFTAVFFLLFCFSNQISYETASYFCIDDSIVFPAFATLSVIMFLLSLYRLTSFSFVFHLFIVNNKLTAKNAKKLSRHMLNGHFSEALIFNARFLPWIFLCISTLGILFLYFIPRYLVAKSLFFSYLSDEKSLDFKKYNLPYIQRTMEVKANEI